jgi:hypothetical protein
MSTEMTQRIESQRNWVKSHFSKDALYKYETTDGKLYLLQTILDKKFYKKDETWELQSLGITFGDALAEKLNLEWVEIEDDYGIDPALRYKETSILLFPLTMISKRIENDEEINIEEFFHGVCNKINELVNDDTTV